jgi:hypothetical protein
MIHAILGAPIAIWLRILIVMLTVRGHCQEAIRKQLASEQAAAAKRIDPSTCYCNLQAGPLDPQFAGETGIELNVNLNYSRTHLDDDPGFRQDLHLQAIYPVTESSTLALSQLTGCEGRILDDELSQPSVNSDSGLPFHASRGHSILGLHDRSSAKDYKARRRW